MMFQGGEHGIEGSTCGVFCGTCWRLYCRDVCMCQEKMSSRIHGAAWRYDQAYVFENNCCLSTRCSRAHGAATTRCPIGCSLRSSTLHTPHRTLQ